MKRRKPGAAEVFHALGDANRRALLERLTGGPVSLSALAEPLGVTLAAVMQHVQILEESGLVTTEKVGRVRTCQIDPQGLHVAAQWIEARRPAWDRKLDRLSDLLGGI